jgi:hypothetical protein
MGTAERLKGKSRDGFILSREVISTKLIMNDGGGMLCDSNTEQKL